MQNKNLEEVFLQLQNAGAQVFFTGGCVRDKLLQRTRKDLDVVVFGINEQTLKRELDRFGQVLTYGKCFPVHQIRGMAVEFSMPRYKESLQKRSLEECIEADAQGRDFTINALYRHVVTGELIDPLNGMKDLKECRIKMSSKDVFLIDPLRIYRAIQLISRLGFHLEPETKRKMTETDTSLIPLERVFEEWNKWLLADAPQSGWQAMMETNAIPSIFPKQSNDIDIGGVPLNMLIKDILTYASRIRKRSADPLQLMWGTLLAPLVMTCGGKETTGREFKDFTAVIDWFRTISRHHRRTDSLEGLLRGTKSFLNLTHRREDVIRLSLMTDAEELNLLLEALAPWWKSTGQLNMIKRQQRNLKRWHPKHRIRPLITGSDLSRLDYIPGPRMGIWLEMAFQMQLEGVTASDILNFFEKNKQFLSKM